MIACSDGIDLQCILAQVSYVTDQIAACYNVGQYRLRCKTQHDSAPQACRGQWHQVDAQHIQAHDEACLQMQCHSDRSVLLNPDI